jgi:hypothetical protein
LRRGLLVVAALVLATGAAMADTDHIASPSGAASITRTIPDTVRFDQEVAAGNAVAMSLTNYGFFGNNFFTRAASWEYPANRGYEHLVRGGLWIGAQGSDANGEFIGVVTGAVDASQGPNSTKSSEFTPADMGITRRSTLPSSQFFDPLRAVSEMDLIGRFNDFIPLAAGDVTSATEPHRPLNIEIRQETYQWNFAEFQNVLFLHLDITNRGELLKNLWVGICTEMCSGCKKCYVNWPGSNSDPSGEGTYFTKKWVVFDDSLKMEREHYCVQFSNPPADPLAGCNLAHVPYWVGIRSLGSKGLAEDTTTRKLSFTIWSWEPGSTLRDEDIERYAMMSTGVIQPQDGDSILPHTGDPVEVFSIGPFPLIYRDSTVSVDFAFVGGYGGPGGGDPTLIQSNSKFAQFAYDHGYKLPIPPPSPKFTAVVRDTAVDLYWDDLSESAYDVTSPDPHDFEGYRLYLGEDPDSLSLVGQFDAAGDTASFNTGFSAIALPQPVTMVGAAGAFTAKYKYSIHGLRDGFKYYAAVTAFDMGNSQIVPLESGYSQNRRMMVPSPASGEQAGRGPTVFPNPYRVEANWDRGSNVRDHFLWFANLPERCNLRIYTLAGDLLFEKKFDGSGYYGDGTRGVYDPAKTLGTPILSGRSFAWNLITRQGQAIATGLYLYSVEDLVKGGKNHVGKFLVVKSDREGQ